MHSATVNTFEEWRAAARRCLQANVAPEHMQWASGQQAELFAAQSSELPPANNAQQALIPQRFISQIKQAACYIGNIEPAAKWALFYSLLWRLAKVNRDTLLIKADAEVQQLARMAKSVSRDKHKMKAFLRFKANGTVLDLTTEPSLLGLDDPVLYTAWFEPEHAIVRDIAPFFAKRFSGMSWSIMTPHGCVHWNRVTLVYTQGIARPEIQEDEFDEFWRTYYCSIFNPARLKEQAMRSEMPKKYWQYLPESICIADLTSGAAARVDDMTDKQATDPARVRQQSRRVLAVQDQLRKTNRL